jgi:hypothetical protein
MRIPRKSLIALLVGVAAMGSKCISINDPGVFSINVKNATGTYAVQAGTSQFGNPPGSNSCVTVDASQYIDENFAVIKGARLVDIIVTTNGSFAGVVSNGKLTINNNTLLTYAGSWNAFNGGQSLLTTSLMTRNTTGVQTLINAIVGRQTLTLCGSGSFDRAATSGLSVGVQVFAQVDVQP